MSWLNWRRVLWPWERIAFLWAESGRLSGLEGRCSQLQLRVNALDVSEANARADRDAWRTRAEAAEALLAVVPESEVA